MANNHLFLEHFFLKLEFSNAKGKHTLTQIPSQCESLKVFFYVLFLLVLLFLGSCKLAT